MSEKYQNVKKYLSDIVPLESELWESMMEHSSEINLRRGTVYSSFGDYTKNIGFLNAGLVRVYYLDELGNEWNKAFLECPDILMPNVNYHERAVSNIAALTDCHIFQISIDFFIKALERYPSLTKIQVQLMTELMGRKTAREIDLLSLSAKERYLKFKKNRASLLESIPQYHIASYLGITPTQLSRIKVAIDQHM